MESLITWNEKYNTGNFVIDYQHQRLVRLINDLDEVRRHEELKPSLLKVILSEVASYTQYHFNTEEEIMTKVEYSEKDEHFILHKNFVKELDLFINEYERGNKDIDKKFCDFLKTWLIGHIATEDKKFMAEVISGHGIV